MLEPEGEEGLFRRTLEYGQEITQESRKILGTQYVEKETADNQTCS
jgi:hypothetical protein